jgi:hypothetical protein
MVSSIVQSRGTLISRYSLFVSLYLAISQLKERAGYTQMKSSPTPIPRNQNTPPSGVRPNTSSYSELKTSKIYRIPPTDSIMAEALYDIKSTMIRKFELSPSKITILSCLNTNPPAGISYSMEQVEFLKKLY